MSEYKEFSGKDVDEAIREACSHFDTTRDKLEIEILSGGSTGIFGLVGVKKAQIKARVRNEVNAKAETTRQKPGARKPEKAKTEKPEADKDGKQAEPAEDRPKAKPEEKPQEEDRAETAEAKPRPKRKRPNRRSRKNGPKPAQPEEKPEAASAEPAENKPPKPAPEKKPEQETPAEPEAGAKPGNGKQSRAVPDEEVKQAVLGIVRRLVEPIVPDPALSVEAEAGLVKVSIENEEHAGLLIGQEGATIQSLQYLANRIAARLVDEELRVHLDAGDYREKQDESLKRMAAHLADKAKSQNKAQSTRPLSSYHRRVVHVALQEDEGISTRSKGDGPMKRVLILPKRSKNNRNKGEQAEE